MMMRNSQESYGFVAKVLHWVMAICLIGMLASGFYMADLPIGEFKLRIYGLHKSFGILILIFAVLRVIWRLANVTPPSPQNLKYAINFVHFALYGFMFFMPFSGLLLSDSAGFPPSFFGFFVVPSFIGYNAGYAKLFLEAHQVLAILGIIGIMGHISAALFHHFVIKDNTLKRML